MDKWVSYREIKERVSLGAVLGWYGAKLKKVNPVQLRGDCPLPSHKSDSKNTFNANLEKNVWNCKSRSCCEARKREGGNVLDFVADMEGCSVREAALKIRERFLTGEDKKISELAAKGKEKGIEPRVEPVQNKPLGFVLRSIDSSHPYLAERGIEKETAELFGVGVFIGKSSIGLSGRLVIPIRDETGELIAYAGRSIDGSEPKYRLPPNFHKSLVLFNLHRAMKEDRRVVAVEGFFDCMKVAQAGFPCVALMGGSLSEVQENLLVENFDYVVLLLDGDSAGREAGIKIASRLSHRLFVRLVSLPDNVQPDNLSMEEISQVLSFLG